MAGLTALRAAVSRCLGGEIRTTRALHGGDLSEVVLVEMEDSRKVVAKSGPLVAREARMLRAMAATGAPAPTVLGLDGTVLLLEALEESHASSAGWRRLGDALALLHGQTGDSFGWEEDYAFGPAAIRNARSPDWVSFWAENRLCCFLSEIPADLAHRVETCAGSLGNILPRRPRAALLHGDLWTGNVLFGPGGAAHLIDPACYFGHHEVDLAMLQLFGRPDDTFRSGYGDHADPPRERCAAYQLWPALVHLRLFGASYRGMVEQRLTLLGQ